MQNRILKELKSKTREQLEKEAGEKSAELVRLRGELVTGRLKNVRLVKAARVHLARVKTLLREMAVKEELAVSEDIRLSSVEDRKRVEP